MGLILNTPATINMVTQCNSLFSSSNLPWWRQSPQRGWFCGTITKKKLHEIAKAINLYPQPGGPLSTEGQRWIKWLKEMDKGSAPTPADRIADCICEAISDTNCAEIVFVVIPTTSTDPTVSCAQVGSGSGYTKLLTVETPTVDTMLRQVRRRKAGRPRSRRKKS